VRRIAVIALCALTIVLPGCMRIGERGALASFYQPADMAHLIEAEEHFTEEFADVRKDIGKAAELGAQDVKAEVIEEFKRELGQKQTQTENTVNERISKYEGVFDLMETILAILGVATGVGGTGLLAYKGGKKRAARKSAPKSPATA
jgi:hypothetical protein